MPTQYPLTAGELASNCWPPDPQTLYNEMFAKGYLSLNLSAPVISSSTPSTTDRDKVWFKIDGSGRPVGQFIFQGGKWIWPHEVPAGGSMRQMWVGSAAALVTYDGGTAGTVSDASGPMWEIDTDFEGRSPMGVGTIPGKTLSPTTIAVGDDLGTAEHTQVEGEVGAHVHEVQLDVQNADGGSGVTALSDNFSTNERQTDTELNQAQGDVTPMNILHPVRGVYMIKRSSRIYRVG